MRVTRPLRSSDAPADPAAYGLRARAATVTAVLDDTGVDRAAYWGYSLGALTGLSVAAHAPGRLTRLVLGAWDPIDGFASALAATPRALGLPPDTDAYALLREFAYADPAQAAIIDEGNETAFRADHSAFSRERGLDTVLDALDTEVLLYCGTADPWWEPMRTVAERTGAAFHSVPGADHRGGWTAVKEVLPVVRAFLAG